VAGNGAQGYAGDGAAATSAALNYPQGVAVDSVGDLFIADVNNNVIRKVTAGTAGIITTVAGNGTAGYSGDGGAAISAEFNYPKAVVVDSVGDLFIADNSNQRVREVAAGTGIITTVAGNGAQGYAGDGAAATSAALNYPTAVAVDSAGDLYIADSFNNVIREVSAGTGVITTVAGNGTEGSSGDGGPAPSAALRNPNGVAVDSVGNVYIADTYNGLIREVSANTTFPTTAIGSTSAAQNVLVQLNSAATITGIAAAQSQGGQQEYTVGTVTGCTVNGTSSSASGTICTVPVTFQPGYPGNRGMSLQVVSNAGNSAFALNGIGTGPQVALTPGTMTTVAGNGTMAYGGDGGAATSANLVWPYGVAMDSAGNLYIADNGNGAVRKVAAGTGVITTVAGRGGFPGYSGDGGLATNALLQVNGVAVDGAGNLYIADSVDSVIREVSAGTGIITTVAGTGHSGYSGDGGSATSAKLYSPFGIAVDGAGNLYIADTYNQRIRKVFAGTGVITTIAGNGASSYGGDGGLAPSAELNYPQAIAVDSVGNLYIADVGNEVIREVSAGTGVITTVAGNNAAGGGYSGDGGLATSAQLDSPTAVAVDSAGDLYIADSFNQRIREVSAGTGVITTVAGNGHYGYSGDGGASTSAEVYQPAGLAVDSVGNLYIGDTINNVVREVEVTMPPTLTFPTATNVGSTDSMDGPQTIAISNIGNAALTLPTSTTGMNPSVAAGFTLDSASTCPSTSSSAGTLASGTNCTFAVDFAPTVAGTISGSLVLTDNTLNAIAPNYATQSIALSGTAVQITLTPATLPGGTTGTAYSQTVTAAGGTAPYTYALSSGTLPAGLTLNPGTGVLSGTPTTAGPYSFAITATDANSFTGTQSYTLTISQGTSTITWATPAAITYGTALGATQLDASSPVAGGFTYSPIAGTVLTAGTHTLTATFTPTNTTDDTTATATVTLMVNQAKPTITWATPAAIAAGTALGTAQLDATASVAGTAVAGKFTYTPAIGTVMQAGSQTLSVTFTPNDTTDYATATSTVTLTVTAATAPTSTTPTLTFAPIATQVEGAAPFAVSATSASSGAVTYAVTSGPATIAGNMVTVTGTGTVVLTATQAASGNYTAATTTISFSVGMPFSLAPATGTTAGSSGSSTSVAPGSTASFSLTLTPTGTTVPDAITFSLTGLPTGATYSFSPATIAAGSKVTPVTLTIQTANTTTTTTARNEQPTSSNPWAPVALGFLLLPLLGMKAARERLRQMPRLPAVLLAVGLSLGAVLGISGCSGGSVTPPTTTTPAAQTYTLVVTATDTTTKAQSTTNLTLTVQ
jgi:trimeric autotransporter adhesin